MLKAHMTDNITTQDGVIEWKPSIPPKVHHIASIGDILALSESELERMLPDLFAMRALAEQLSDIATPWDSFQWIDDGEPGLRYLDFINPATGAKTRIGLTGEDT